MAMKGRRKNGRMDIRRASGKQKVAFVLALIPTLAVAGLVWYFVHASKFARFSGLACVVTALLVGTLAEYATGKIASKLK